MHSGSAFSGYRFPPEVILTALRWYFSYALSAQQVMELLADRGMDVSRRTILRWAQTFGPLLGLDEAVQYALEASVATSQTGRTVTHNIELQ